MALRIEKDTPNKTRRFRMTILEALNCSCSIHRAHKWGDYKLIAAPERAAYPFLTEASILR